MKKNINGLRDRSIRPSRTNRFAVRGVILGVLARKAREEKWLRNTAGLDPRVERGRTYEKEPIVAEKRYTSV